MMQLNGCAGKRVFAPENCPARYPVEPAMVVISPSFQRSGITPAASAPPENGNSPKNSTTPDKASFRYLIVPTSICVTVYFSSLAGNDDYIRVLPEFFNSSFLIKIENISKLTIKNDYFN
jgi:hypothetical protein